MKKILYLGSILVLSTALVACNTDPAPENEKVEVTDQNQNDEIKDEGEEIKEDAKEVGTDVKEQAKEVGEDVKEKADELVMTDEEMIDAADYIAKVRIVEDKDSAIEDALRAELIENVKGDLTGKEVPNDEGFKKDEEYLIFLKDEGEKVVPVNDQNHYQVLNGEDDELLKKVNDRLDKK